VRLIVFGAHPDDCEVRCAGLAAKLASHGHAVKFVNLTDGGCGHHEQYGTPLVARRARESAEAARRLGIAEVETLANPDASLEPTLANRVEVVRRIREWKADVVITHRPNDYHADHRYTAQLVMDAAFLVQVPGFCPDAPALRRNPCFLYMQDDFRLPTPFSSDLVVDVADEWERKVDAVDAHVSQFYEWLPWLDGVLDQVPESAAGRKRFLAAQYLSQLAPPSPAGRPCERFELSEYGGRLQLDQWRPLLSYLTVRDNVKCFYEQTT
jgi:LmbE family N-acetylglucosaminyl deacetylase